MKIRHQESCSGVQNWPRLSPHSERILAPDVQIFGDSREHCRKFVIPTLTLENGRTRHHICRRLLGVFYEEKSSCVLRFLLSNFHCGVSQVDLRAMLQQREQVVLTLVFPPCGEVVEICWIFLSCIIIVILSLQVVSTRVWLHPTGGFKSPPSNQFVDIIHCFLFLDKLHHQPSKNKLARRFRCQSQAKKVEKWFSKLLKVLL